MSLETQINTDLKTAMKAKDKATMRTLRAIKSAILLQKTDGSGKALDEAGEMKLLQKLAKQRAESLTIYEKQNREDLAVKEREELQVIEKYLPKPISQEEIKAVVKGVIDQVGATSMRDMGKVMGLANKQLAGKADGRVISTIVKELLS